MQALETKGLDIVRRDWCQLSRDVGQFCLEQILSGRDVEDVTEAVHEHLRTVREQVNAGQVGLDKFVVTKQLTKRIEDYPDAKSQAHVQVCGSEGLRSPAHVTGSAATAAEPLAFQWICHSVLAC